MKKKKTVDFDFKNDISKLTNSIKELKIYLVNKDNDKNTKKPINSTSCYNCRQLDHMAKDCTVPCKLCRGEKGQHPFYQCSLYKPKIVHENENINNSALLCTLTPNEVFSTKRTMKIKDDENKRIRIDDLLNKTEVQPLKEMEITESEPMKLEIIKSGKTKNETKKNRARISVPIAEEPIGIKSIVNATNFKVSLAQLADLSPAFRAELKRTITKSNYKMNDKTKKLNNTPVLYTDASEHGAPRTIAQVRNFETATVLDGGSVTNIASLDFVSKIGYTTMDPIRREYVFANGSRAVSLGVLTKLPVKICGRLIYITVTIFDHKDYTLLLVERH